jgi:Resolvase, N terminal domain
MSRRLKMTSSELLPATVLNRKAVVYVRQSTQSQVMTNLESQRRQYDLVELGRQRGFADVEIIDYDLGRSASGTVARPGFDRLVAWLCAGKVGAVLCFDASRLARNGRDWHHLLELCGLVEARVIDLDGVYNPCRPNDRLLPGMKGSISEFELGRAPSATAGCRPLESSPRRAAIISPVRLCLASRTRTSLLTLTCASRK